MNRFKSHMWWIVTLLLSIPVVVIAAVPNVFQSGTAISSAEVNANFAALDARITTLETAINRSGATLLPSQTGALPKAIAFTSKGGPLLLVASGSAFSPGGQASISVSLQLDAKTIGELRTFANEGGSHKAFPTRAFPVVAPSGTHTLNIIITPGNTVTSTDSNDFFSVTVVELAH